MYGPIKGISGNNTLSLKITAGLTEKENADLCRLIESRFSKFGRIRLYLILENYPMADSAESLLEDLKFARLCADKIEKMAVVGNRAWQKTWTALFALFGQMEIAFFDRTETDDAARWITS